MPVRTGFLGGNPNTHTDKYNQLPPLKSQSFKMAITEGAKIGHTTSRLLSFLFFRSKKKKKKSCFQFLLPLQSLKTVQADGLVRPGLTVFVYKCSHCTDVSMHRMCLCVYCVYLRVLSVLQHPGAVEYQWRSLGLCLSRPLC